MASLSFSSMTELKAQGELDPKLRKQLHKVTCDRVFESYLALFKQAVKASADPENQYIYYARCGELGKMIMQKNGFQQFSPDKKRDLGNTFKTVLSQMETVEAMLTKAYQQNNEIVLAPVLTEEPSSAVIPKVPEPVKVKVTIQPRELIRAVEQEKKSAVILDFRSDQTKKTIQYNKGATQQVTVIPIPRDLVNPGLLFHALKLRLPTGHRPYLSRLQSSDYVVIMEDEASELVNDRPLPSTKAGILQLALTEYNPTEKLKSQPLFMEGGFKKWHLQYPTYVHNTDQDDAFMFHDALETQLSFDYPEFSPRRVAVEKTLEEPAVVPSRESITPPVVPSPSPDSISEPQEVPETVSSLSQLPHRPSIPERTTKPAKVPPTEPKCISPVPAAIILEPSEMAPRLAGGHPSVDRGNKPGESLPRTIPSNTPIPSKPSLDRTTKPSLQISAQERHQLLGIYQMMAENIAQNAVRRGGARPGQTGLYNMGNTCFMNACLQALFQTPHLVDVFTRDYFTSKVNTQNPLGTNGVISAVFSALVDNAWSGEFNAFKPQRFLGVFAKEVNSMLTNGQQQDASEFYMMFLASLHEDTNQVLKGTPPVTDYTGGANIRKEAVDFDRKQSQYNYSPISQILHPRTISEVTCSTCRAQSVTFDDVNIIQVGLPPPSMNRCSLVDCLHKSFSSTNLDGRWNCPSCKTARPASQKISLWNLSPVIVVHLLRFSFSGGDYVKNDIAVQFDPDHLDMKPFLHASADRTVESSYKLYSVTNHRGRLNSGHYTAYSRHLKSGEWLRFDDETVSPGRSSDINYSDAYILYFKRKGL